MNLKFPGPPHCQWPGTGTGDGHWHSHSRQAAAPSLPGRVRVSQHSLAVCWQSGTQCVYVNVHVCTVYCLCVYVCNCVQYVYVCVCIMVCMCVCVCVCVCECVYVSMCGWVHAVNCERASDNASDFHTRVHKNRPTHPSTHSASLCSEKCFDYSHEMV